MKLCVYFGTFNPIHNAHLAVANFIRANYDFDVTFDRYIQKNTDAKKLLVEPEVTNENGLTSIKYQLTDTLTGQWYCYELQRDPTTGNVIGSVDKDDCLAAVKGLYTPAQRDQIGFMADSAVGEPFELTVDELVNVDGVVMIDNDFVPEKDGYYFCMITNRYNDKETTISTPLAYYDSSNDA